MQKEVHFARVHMSPSSSAAKKKQDGASPATPPSKSISYLNYYGICLDLCWPDSNTVCGILSFRRTTRFKPRTLARNPQ